MEEFDESVCHPLSVELFSFKKRKSKQRHCKEKQLGERMEGEGKGKSQAGSWMDVITFWTGQNSRQLSKRSGAESKINYLMKPSGIFSPFTVKFYYLTPRFGEINNTVMTKNDVFHDFTQWNRRLRAIRLAAVSVGRRCA